MWETMQNVKIISAKGFWDKTQRLETIQNVISKTTLKIKSLCPRSDCQKGYVKPMLGNLGSMPCVGTFGPSELEKAILGLLMFPCWGIARLGWANVGQGVSMLGLMLSQLQPMWGRWWVIWWALWASMEVSREKITPNGKACPLRVILGHFLGLCQANVGPFWDYVGPMVGHLVGFMGFHGGFWREKITPNGKACALRVILGHLLRLCRANVEPFWVYVGPTLGHLMGFLGFHGAFCGQKKTYGKLVLLRVFWGCFLPP